MSQPIDEKRLLDENQMVDALRLERDRALLKELRDKGIVREGYRLAPPFSRKPSSPRPEDPRTIRLRTHR